MVEIKQYNSQSVKLVLLDFVYYHSSVDERIMFITCLERQNLYDTLSNLGESLNQFL